MLALFNMFLFRRLARGAEGAAPSVSVLIPARNEERSIRPCLESVLASDGVELEVVVLDDQSTDRTASIVGQIAASDRRVRLERGAALPADWCGKQYACHRLSQHATHDVMVFIDCDVRLSTDAIRRIAIALQGSPAGLLSGFPRQATVTWLEQLLIPLIHFVLLSYLPMLGARLTKLPGFAAGCGQLMAVKRDAYLQAGGHGAIRESLHDGITLPRAFRRAGVWTDLFDASDMASCRMYRSGREVWQGLAKNATEGMASPRGIGVWTVFLVGGQVMPALILAWLAAQGRLESTPWWILGPLLAPWVIRILQALRYGLSLVGAILHPLGVLLLVGVQWYALISKWRGRASSWKGRVYAST